MAFNFKLEHEEGTPADLPSFQTSVPTWRQGDEIPLGNDRMLSVIDTRDDGDGALLIVEDKEEGAPNAESPTKAGLSRSSIS